MDWAPERCTCGKPLKAPNAKVSWTPCPCSLADGSPRGHQYVMCIACKREVRKGGCEHLVDGYEVAGPDTSGVAL